GGLVVAALLAIAIVMLFQQPPPSGSQARAPGRAIEVQSPSDDGGKKTDKETPVKPKDGKPADKNGKDGKPGDKNPDDPENKKPPQPELDRRVAIEAPRPGRVVVGKYKLPDRPAVLLQESGDGKQWRRLSVNKDEWQVYSGSRLVSLPGYQSTVDLDKGVRLTLWGSLLELYEYQTELVSVKDEKGSKKTRIPFLMQVFESLVTPHE